jgi:GT2 family glycosyltransferase
MNEQPAVSILMPFHNAEATIDAALASIRRQRRGDFELLAVDDGSTDSSPARVAALARDDQRLRLLSPGRLGLVGALNHGLAAARAPLLARMDADDLMHPDRLGLQLAALAERPELALLACRVAMFPWRDVRAGYREYLRWQNDVLSPADVAANIYVEAPFAHPAVVFRRAAVVALGGYHDGPFPEDYELWLRMHQAGLPMAKLPRVLLAWREGAGRHSRSDPRYGREAFDRLRAEYLAADPRLQSGRPLAYWGSGRRTRLRAAHLIGRGFPPSAWIDIDPDKIGWHIAGVPVHPPAWLGQAPRPFVLVYVTSHGAREHITPILRRLGYRPGDDYLFVG